MTRETIKEMRARHEREIKELQDSCSHPTISHWMSEMWAPGHLTGDEVKICEVCGKEVGRRRKSQKRVSLHRSGPAFKQRRISVEGKRKMKDILRESNLASSTP